MESVKMIMEFVIANKTTIIAFILCAVLIVREVINFIQLPTDKKKAKVKEILLAWVVKADTSNLYEKFKATYPWMSKWISEEEFNSWVNDAVEDVKDSLAPAAYQQRVSQYCLKK